MSPSLFQPNPPDDALGKVLAGAKVDLAASLASPSIVVARFGFPGAVGVVGAFALACGSVVSVDSGVRDAGSGGSAPGGASAVGATGGSPCGPGFGDCDGDPTNGCEADLGDVAHCGACGVVCGDANGLSFCDTLKGCSFICNAGFGACDGAAGNGCESPLDADPNCGGCGVDCATDCLAGLCDGAVDLATGLSFPSGIAVDAMNVYWTLCDLLDPAGGSIMKMPKGGGPITTLVQDSLCVLQVAVDATHVYWTTGTLPGNYDGTVKKMPLEGGPIVTLAAAQSYPNVFLIGAGRAFWTTSHWDGSPEDHFVLSVPLAGGVPTVLDSGKERHFMGLAIDGTHLYWANVGFPVNGQVTKKPLAGGPSEVVYMGPGGPGAVAVDSQHVYFTLYLTPYYSGQAVMRSDLDGAMLTTLATGQHQARYMAVDATNVYWANQVQNGSIKKLPIEGGTLPLTIASAQDPWGIAIDETSIYWTDDGSNDLGDGSIRKAPK